MHNDRFYDNVKKYDVERSLVKNGVCDEDRSIILNYLRDKVRVDHISDARYRKIGFSLILVKKHVGKPFRDATIDDYLDAIQAIKSGERIGMDGVVKRYSKNTVYDTSIILKGFLKWLHKKGLTSIDLQDILDMRAPSRKDLLDSMRPEDLLTEDEVIRMAGCAKSQRDRTLILVTYETGARIGEIGRLTWRDVVFERLESEDGSNVVDTAKVYIEDTKESQKRYSRLTLSAPDLRLLKNQMNPSPSSFVFVDVDGKPMSYVAMYRVFQRAATRAGVTKPVRPHLFRHARATAMVRMGVQESIIKKTLWNNPDTKMFKVYLSLGEDAIDNEMLKHTGIKRLRESYEKKLENTPRMCGVCHTVNPVGSSYCNTCGSPLTRMAVEGSQDLLKHLRSRQSYQEIMERLARLEAEVLKEK